MTTNETTSLILDFFFRKGIYARRHGVASGTAEYTNKKGETSKRFVHGGITGGLDIFVWLPPNGQFLSIDVKTGKDKLRPEQIGFMVSTGKMGCLSFTVKDYPDFLEKIKEFIHS
jgi:hypothetical protein